MKQLNPVIEQTRQAIQLCQQGEFEQARKVLLMLEQAQGLNDDACFLMGSILGQLGQYEKALEYFQRAIDLAPDKSQAYVGQARALLTMGRPGEAEICYDRLIDGNSGSIENILQLAAMLQEYGHYHAAEQRYLKVLEKDEDSAIALLALGRVCQSLRKTEIARNYYQRTIRVDPGNSNAHFWLGTLLFNQGQVEEAEACYRKALELDGQNVQAYRDLGYLQLSLNRPEQAREQFQSALAIQPRNLDVIAALARLEDQLGNIQTAYDLVNPFIERNIMHVDIGIVYAGICRYFKRCREAIDYLERILSEVGDQYPAREKLFFALAKLYDRIGEYDRAFSYLEQGNLRKPDLYNRVEDAACMDELIRTCDWNYFVSAPRSTNSTEQPLFIVGMPRSGTTLIEQILASHPEVHGLGEVSVFPAIIQNLQSYLGAGTAYPGNLRNLTPAILDSMAETYLDGVGRLGPIDTLRFTDKTLVNFLYVGLILQIFPKARIIHCVRDPRDTCLSIFFQNFDDSHYYASRLENLGDYYSQYRRVMNHWSSLLGDSILEIKYEDLVQDQESKSRELIEFVGLEWDECVLRFYESKRSVVTASYDQVRQKIYTGSTSRWKNYEKYLAPLVDSLDFPLKQDA